MKIHCLDLTCCNFTYYNLRSPLSSVGSDRPFVEKGDRSLKLYQQKLNLL
ncbi:MAG: hypothetical protein F6J93_23040 [Oscillatoria sp. SIO1A7]|nr:hypothetical protein [Oscillatoria sp. SIO1A7]